MIHEGAEPPTDDTKDMMIAGCHVRLAYERSLNAGWTVNATIVCGIDDKAAKQLVVTQPFDTRDALQQITSILGHQTDRSHSRSRNWS
jgi:hypothetical protein